MSIDAQLQGMGAGNELFRGKLDAAVGTSALIRNLRLFGRGRKVIAVNFSARSGIGRRSH